MDHAGNSVALTLRAQQTPFLKLHFTLVKRCDFSLIADILVHM